MGKRGPAPTPLKILEARGSWRAKLREKEPPADGKEPALPGGFTGEHKIVWMQLVAYLRALGILSSSDSFLMTQYCEAWCRWRDAERHLKRHGNFITVLSRKGVLRSVEISPAIAVADKQSMILGKIGQQLGLSPSGRASLAIKVAKESLEVPDAPVGSKKADKLRFFK